MLFKMTFRSLAVANALEPEVVFLFSFCCEGHQQPGVNHPTQDGVVFGTSTWYELLLLKDFSNGKKKRDASAYFLTLSM
jgi:hypothetical protein